jgi:MOSC domain-containing protein YiiM
MGELTSIVYTPKGATPNSEGYTRLPLQEARLVAGYGIEGDTKGTTGKRQINIMTQETVQQLGTEGFLVKPGQLGEQLLVSGVDVNVLSPGTRLQIGETAQLEIVEPRTGCGKFEKYQSRQRTEAAGRLGMIAIVVADGAIRVGDAVSVVTE